MVDKIKAAAVIIGNKVIIFIIILSISSFDQQTFACLGPEVGHLHALLYKPHLIFYCFIPLCVSISFIIGSSISVLRVIIAKESQVGPTMGSFQPVSSGVNVPTLSRVVEANNRSIHVEDIENCEERGNDVVIQPEGNFINQLNCAEVKVDKAVGYNGTKTGKNKYY